ncbi:MAG: MOSC domain-containing protein [Propioniciclava sp.]
MQVISVNIGRLEPTAASRTGMTGHRKRPVDAVRVTSPTVERGHSGLGGDEIGDAKHHGGTDQAVYAYAAEDLDWWAEHLGTPLPPGSFGENLTTSGFDVNATLIGERWRIGDQVELVLTDPRIPCRTFAGEMDRRGWVKQFTAACRPGPYLRVAVPGTIRVGDPIRVLERPDHPVTIAKLFAAMTTQPQLARHCQRAGDALTTHAQRVLEKRVTARR